MKHTAEELTTYLDRLAEEWSAETCHIRATRLLSKMERVLDALKRKSAHN